MFQNLVISFSEPIFMPVTYIYIDAVEWYARPLCSIDWAGPISLPYIYIDEVKWCERFLCLNDWGGPSTLLYVYIYIDAV